MTSSNSNKETLSAKLLARLGQEGVTDLYLLSSDGVRVPAFRAVLACRSDVFYGMLCGEFKEAAAEQVNLDYTGETLRAVVEFCITDVVKRFDGRQDEATARSLVDLFACAHFLQMPLLQEKARVLLESLMESKKSLACAAFDEALLCGEATESVKLVAFNVIRTFPETSLLSKPGILSLGTEALTEIISDENVACEEITIFRALDQ